MKKIYIFFILIIGIVIFCYLRFGKKRDELTVHSLSPYADSIKFSRDEDVSNERRNGIQIRYFVCEDNMDYTQRSKDKMDGYITRYLKNEIKTHPAIYFTFYRDDEGLDKDSHHTAAELEEKFAKSKYAEYEYINGKLFNFDFYKNGEYYVPIVDDDPNN